MSTSRSAAVQSMASPAARRSVSIGVLVVVSAVFWQCMSIRPVLYKVRVQYRRRRRVLTILGREVRLGHVGTFRTPIAGSMSERVPIVYLVDDDEVTRSYFNAVLSTANVTYCRIEPASSLLAAGRHMRWPANCSSRFIAPERSRWRVPGNRFRKSARCCGRLAWPRTWLRPQAAVRRPDCARVSDG